MWARSENNKDIRVGFTHVPCASLGDVVFAELPPPGTDVRAGEPVGLVESSLAVCEVVAPVSGIVVNVNPLVVGAPEKITADPFEGGWLLEIRPSDPAELASLLTGQEYDRSFPREE
jgi:glycine cleavage system H protein